MFDERGVPHVRRRPALGGWIGIYTDVSVITAIYWWRLLGMRWLPVAQRLRARLVAERGRGAIPALALEARPA